MFIIALFLCYTLTIRAETLPEVVVIGRKFTLPNTDIHVKDASYSDLANTLRESSQANVVKTGNSGYLSTATFYGNTSKHTTTLLNGIPINNLTSGAYNINGMNGLSINNIHIHNGVRALLHSSNVLGTVMEFKLNYPSKTVSLSGKILTSSQKDVGSSIDINLPNKNTVLSMGNTNISYGTGNHT